MADWRATDPRFAKRPAYAPQWREPETRRRDYRIVCRCGREAIKSLSDYEVRTKRLVCTKCGRTNKRPILLR